MDFSKAREIARGRGKRSRWPNLWTGMRGYWSMLEGCGDTIFDPSGRGNNGTLYGPTWVMTERGWAPSFDGVDDYIEITIPNFGTGNFTLVTTQWVDSTHTAAYPVICSIGDTGAGEWMLREIAGAIEFYGDGGGINVELAASVEFDVWESTAIRRRGTVCDLFHLGKYRTSDTSAGDDLNSTKTLRLGNADGVSHRFFKGKLGPILVYDRSLTPNEIQLLHEVPNAPLVPRTIHYPTAVAAPPTFSGTNRILGGGILSY